MTSMTRGTTTQTPKRRTVLAIMAFVAASTPLAMGVEAVIRRLLLPPVFDDVREWLRPSLTPVAWAMGLVALAATGLGCALRRRFYDRFAARPEGSLEDRRARAQFESLMIAASVPQIPALLATILAMLGADLTASWAAVGVATCGVLVVWILPMRAAVP